MNKRGQITIFIIIGVVLLLAGSLFFYVRGSQSKTALDSNVESVIFSTQVQPIRYYVNTCLELVTNDALYRLGKGGGFVNPRASPLGSPWITEGAEFTYTYQRPVSRDVAAAPLIDLVQINSYPTLSNMEKDMESFVEDDDFRRLRECLDEFSFFRQKAYQITSGHPKVNISIGKDAVVSKLTYPLTVKIGENIAAFSIFTYTIPVKLPVIRKYVIDITTGVRKCENTIYTELLNSVNDCGRTQVNEQLINDECKWDESVGNFMGGLSDFALGYKDEIGENFQTVLTGLNAREFDNLIDVDTTEYDYKFEWNDPDIDYYVYGYNDSLWYLYATFFKDFPKPFGGSERQEKTLSKDEVAYYNFVHILVDRKGKVDPFVFLFATKRNYDIIIKDRKISCN